LSRNCSIAICYTNITEAQIASVEPIIAMVNSSRTNFTFSGYLADTEPTVDIHYCIRSFCETEKLDDENAWSCPTCDKHQIATKTISICRFPDYLMVHFKRFMYADFAGGNKLNNKITFPLNDLDLTSHLAPECANELTNVYDLYSFVCHYGSMNAGHYTAFGKNPITNKWRYFNDSVVTDNQPTEIDCAAAYVLFYKRKGIQHNIPKLKRPIIPYTIPRPIGMASPISSRKYSNDGGVGNRADSSGGSGSRSITNGSGDGISQVRIVDENTIGELSLSAGNTRFKDPTHPHLSSTRHDFTSGRATRVSPQTQSATEETLTDDEDLPDIEEHRSYNGSQQWNGNGLRRQRTAFSATNQRMMNGNANGCMNNINGRLSRNRPRPMNGTGGGGRVSPSSNDGSTTDECESSTRD